eukprot:CAMPEP_0115337300 /NCGR_PEP_ID=MMETSP0270-20121206/89459_1 /TAXON_ID=71861 /ORGANISM="Scrippsiella trochoidea, Strain CCMP3099" /LENGTH=49 /DNA_ID=CAMNT_0002758517 /DNA_START=219 /DNA_END=368 /DNA_ORIENTATION=-
MPPVPVSLLMDELRWRCVAQDWQEITPFAVEKAALPMLLLHVVQTTHST